MDDRYGRVLKTIQAGEGESVPFARIRRATKLPTSNLNTILDNLYQTGIVGWAGDVNRPKFFLTERGREILTSCR